MKYIKPPHGHHFLTLKLFFSRKERRERKDSGPVTLALEGRSFARRERRGWTIYPPPPPTGTRPCLRGRVSYSRKHTAPANCPPETGGTRSEATEGVDESHASALSCRSVAHDSSSASVKCNGKKLCALCGLCVKYIKPPDMDISFSRKERRSEGPPQSPSRGKSG